MMNLYNEFLDDWSEKWFQDVLNSQMLQSLNFNYHTLSVNSNISWKIISANLDKFPYKGISLHP